MYWHDSVELFCGKIISQYVFFWYDVFTFWRCITSPNCQKHYLKRKHFVFSLTHWGRQTHICIGKLTIIASDNGLSPWRRQAIIWNNAGILLIGPLGTNFNEILIEIHTLSFKKMHFKISSAKWRPFCIGLNVWIDSWNLYSGKTKTYLSYKVDIVPE